jgi:hypothetical protein
MATVHMATTLGTLVLGLLSEAGGGATTEDTVMDGVVAGTAAAGTEDGAAMVRLAVMGALDLPEAFITKVGRTMVDGAPRHRDRVGRPEIALASQCVPAEPVCLRG